MMIKKIIIISAFISVVHIAGIAQSFSISKFSGNNPVSNQSFIYALPKTGLHITLKLTKTTLTKGLYAEYAKKYLGLTNVPLEDYENWEIADIKINPLNEPDPEHYYSLSFKTLPENLQTLFSMDNKGVVLRFSDDWKRNYLGMEDDNLEPVIYDPYYIDEPIKEKVDTLYKTVVTDSTFTRIPVFKKQIQAKTTEELAKEAAHELIKTRKRRVKFTRGEFEYHPDSQTLLFMINEMQKIEEYYLSLFLGVKKEEKLAYSYTIYPSKDLSTQELCSFGSEKGILNLPSPGMQTISVQFLKENGQNTPGLITEKQEQNLLYFRVPAMIKVSLFINQEEKVQNRIPFYQFGSIQGMTLKK